MATSWKNMFFVTDNTEDEKKVEQPKVDDSVHKTQPIIVVNNSENSIGTPDEQMINSLVKVLDERNIPGPDYYELSLTAKSLINILPDESTRFKAAFTTMQASNKSFTKDIVVNSIDTYVGMMESERKSGLNELALAKTEKVDKARNSIKDKIDTIDKLLKQIEAIQQQIANERAEVDIVQQNADKIELELKKQENNFNASVDVIINQLTSDKNKLVQIL